MQKLDFNNMYIISIVIDKELDKYQYNWILGIQLIKIKMKS